MAIQTSAEILQQQRIENSIVLGSVALGGAFGYEFGNRLYEGKSSLGKVVEYSLKAGAVAVGSAVGLVTATYALLAKQEAEEYMSRGQQ